MIMTSIRKYIDRLERIDQMIRWKNTGTPKEFACKLGISKRCLYDYLEELKTFGAVILYDKKNKTYFYEQDGHFIAKFIEKNK